MRYQFLMSVGAQEDMKRCRAADPYAVAKISALLREVISDEVICEALIDERYYGNGIEVDVLWYLQDIRINAYRVKLLEVAGWRLITVADHPGKRVGLFGVMERDQDYEKDAALTARIEREIDDYGFPRLP